MLLVLIVVLVGVISSGASWDWEAVFYSGDDSGSGLSAQVKGENAESCVNLTSYKLCGDEDEEDALSCVTLKWSARSVDTKDTCVRLYSVESCSGAPMMQLFPGTLCHRHWLNCRITDRVMSISGCPSDDHHLRIITPSSSLIASSIDFASIPSNNHTANGTKTWIITVPYEMKVEMTLKLLGIDHEKMCKLGKLTISELVSKQVIFGGCGAGGRSDPLPLSPIVSKSNQVRVTFASESNSIKKGTFSLFWRRCVSCHPTHNTSAQPDPPIDDSVIEEVIDMDNFHIFDPSTSSPQESIPEIKFCTYKRGNKDRAVNGWMERFASGQKHMFYAHGYTTTTLDDGFNIKNATFKGTDDVDTVTLVDWRKLSLPYEGAIAYLPPSNYRTVALQNVPKVAAELKDFILTQIEEGGYVYLVGFSLGSHTVATAARNVTAQTNGKRVVNRVTGLDPANPIFESSFYGPYYFGRDTTNTIRPSDAAFVDIIHSSFAAWPQFAAGMRNEAGALDVYVEEIDCRAGGINPVQSCKHKRAVEVFLASLTDCSLITCPSNLIRLSDTDSGSYREYTCDTTNEATVVSSAGYLADRYEGRGRHKIYLYKSQRRLLPPVYRRVSTGNCSSFQNINLPAKNRICKGAPLDATDPNECFMKPYLTTCSLKCGSQKSICTYSSESLSQVQVETRQGDACTRCTQWSPQTCRRQESCRNEAGEPVSFFIAYKLENSSKYFLISPNEQGAVQPIRLSEYGVDHNNSVFSQTLSPIYSASSVNSINYFMWNGDDKGSTTNDTGHSSRGVLAFNSISGFLLIHSIPDFPSAATTGHYEFSESGKEHAHIAICTSLQNNEKGHLKLLDYVVENMRTFSPNVYSSRITEQIVRDENSRLKIENLINPLKEELDNEFVPSPLTRHLIMNIEPGIVLITVGRSKQFVNIFEQLAYSYQDNLIVKTWNDENSTVSSCGWPYTVENIREITIQNRTIRREADHSTWAMIKPYENPDHYQPHRIIRTCIGDWNRATTTKKKMGGGGMFICTWNKEIFNAFSEFSPKIDSCK